MRVSTLDPMTLQDVTDLDNAPFVVEGEGDGAIKIYFQSQENRRAYLDMEMHGPENSEGLKAIFDEAGKSAITGSIN